MNSEIWILYICTVLNFAVKHTTLSRVQHILLPRQVFVCSWKWMPLCPPISQHEPIYSTQRGYDLHCAAPFKNLSPHSRAGYKSEAVDWDILSWLLAQGLRPVMNAAIICWCMKREVHHRLLHIKPRQSFSVLVTAPLTGTQEGQLYH